MAPPSPSSFEHRFAVVNGIRMHYVVQGTGQRGTVVLCHGWPDLWYGWRYQIAPLAAAGYRVVVPDQRGFGLTDAPADLATYGTKTLTADLVALLDHLNVPRAVFLGHDWGGTVAWRMPLFHPQRVVAVGGVCTPYTPPQQTYVSLDEVVERLPQLAYQKYLAGPVAASELEANLELLFRAIHRSSDESDAIEFTQYRPDAFLENFGQPPRSPMVSAEEIDYYVTLYRQRGAQGGLNWYKTRQVCFEDERHLGRQIDHPALMVTVGRDPALPASMASKMERNVSRLTRAHIEEAGHWVLVERHREINKILLDWLNSLPASAWAPERAVL